MTTEQRASRLKQAFEKLARHTIVYKKAVLSSAQLNAYETVDSYEEIEFKNCAVNSASDRTKLYSIEYEAKLYVKFIVDNGFEVNKVHDRVVVRNEVQGMSNKEYKITDFSFLEQIPGLRKCELEIEIASVIE